MGRSPANDGERDWPALLRPFHEARGILLAVSGGPDSTALMHVAADWARLEPTPPLSVACVDHGLRAGSDGDADTVRLAAQALGLPAAVLSWMGPKPDRAIQEMARKARYSLLVSHANAIGASHLVTAHTLDDQAETVLFRLSRGSGPAGLAGMRPSSERDGLIHARPFLGVRKAELVGLCLQRAWCFIEDPANTNQRFARTRFRAAASLLEREGLTPERLAHLATRLARSDDALQQAAHVAERRAVTTRRDDVVVYTMAELGREPLEIVTRVLQIALTRLTGHDRGRLDRLEAYRDALVQHHRSGIVLRSTLQGCILTLDSDAGLEIRREKGRRRGRSPPGSHAEP